MFRFVPEMLIAGAGVMALCVLLTVMNMLKLKKLPKLIASAVVVAICAIFMGKAFLTGNAKDKEIDRINYMSSYLIDLGEYDVAMDFMLNNESSNQTLQQLEILDLAYDNNKDVARTKASVFLSSYGQDEIVSNIENALNILDAADYKKELDGIHTAIKRNIKGSVDEQTLKSLDVVLNKNSGKNISNDELQRSVAILSKSKDAAVIKEVAKANVSVGDDLIGFAEKAVGNSDLLVNKIFVANTVASNPVKFDDKELTDLQKEVSSLESDIKMLESQVASLDSSSAKAKQLQAKIEANKKDYEETKKTLNYLNVVRAENYLKNATTKEEKETPLYQAEMAALQYMKGENEEAEKQLQTAVASVVQDGNCAEGSTAVLLLTSAYAGKEKLPMASTTGGTTAGGTTGGTSGGASGSGVTTGGTTAGSTGTGADSANKLITENDCWYALTSQLTQGGCINSSALSSNSGSFESYVRTTFESYKGQMFISEVGTDDFDNHMVDLYINVAGEDSRKYAKEDFIIYDNGEKIGDFEIVETSSQENINICFVMDVSGSMRGDSIVNAKNSAVNFISALPSGTNIGLVSFESDATVVADITTSAGVVLKGVDTLEASGGTEISSGLNTALTCLKSKKGKKIIILMTDGEDSSSSKNKMEGIKQQIADQGITVYAVGFDSANESYLTGIADAGNGMYIGASDAANLATVYATFGKYIKNDYHIRYKVSKDVDSNIRDAKVYCAGSYIFDKEYSVGLTADKINADSALPKTDYFFQVGGSGPKAGSTAGSNTTGADGNSTGTANGNGGVVTAPHPNGMTAMKPTTEAEKTTASTTTASGNATTAATTTAKGTTAKIEATTTPNKGVKAD